jgi:Ca2+-binding RTX toxin-like protein
VQAFGDTENDTVNVSSDAPTNMGKLNLIVGNLSIDTGTGTDNIVLSDCGETTLANSNVIVTNSTVTGFAGATNGTSIHYVYGGTLTMKLIGSNTLNDHFDVQLTSYPAAPTLTLQFDGKGQPAGGMDTVRIDGTTGDDTVKVGVFGSVDPYQIQNIECLQLFGGTGNDTLINDSNTSSLIDGGDGADLLVGGSNVDVIFGGDGVDTIYGRSGGDYLFADHEFNNRSPRVKHSVGGDHVFGDAGFDPVHPLSPSNPADPFAQNPGVDTIVAVGSDIINAGGQVGDTIIGAGLQLSVEDWLRARFLAPNSKNTQAAITAALKQPCTMI